MRDDASFLIAAQAALALRALQDDDLRQRIAADILQRPHEGLASRPLAATLQFAARILLEKGDRSGAEKVWRELVQLADKAHDAYLQANGALGPKATAAFFDGQLEECLEIVEEALNRVEEFGVAQGLNLRGLRARLTYYLGTIDDSIADGMSDGSRTEQALKALALTYLGRPAEAQAIRARFGDIGSEADESGALVLAGLFE